MANNNNNKNQAAVEGGGEVASSTTDDVSLQSSSVSSSSSDTQSSSLNDISSNSKVQGPLGIDPLRYTEFLFSLLLIWILYLLVPRGLRVTYCGAYPKRYSWSSRIKRKRKQQQMHLPHHHYPSSTVGGMKMMPLSSPSVVPLKHSPISGNLSVAAPSTYISLDPFHIGDINTMSNNNNNNNNAHNAYMNATTAKATNRKEQQLKQQQQQQDFDLLQIHNRDNVEEMIHFQSPPVAASQLPKMTSATTQSGGGPNSGVSKSSFNGNNNQTQDMLLSMNSTNNDSMLSSGSNAPSSSSWTLPPLSTKSERNATPPTNNNNSIMMIPPVQPNLTFTNTSLIYPSNASTIAFHDEIAISTTMSRLRDVGVLVMAHGSKGKPKSVRLFLKENAIVWRTEIIKQQQTDNNNNTTTTNNNSTKIKVGKEHQVPLTDILYVDVGKQTTALRRMENASIDELLCFSLLTKEGSLDLESTSMEERDALVSCFSMILDEVHKSIGGEQGSWRDLYRAPSSDLPSSFDEYDTMQGGNSGGIIGIRSNPGDEIRGVGGGSGGFALLEM